MKFHEQLEIYISLLSSNAKEISLASGISPATLSRYRNGDRIPEYNTELFESLCKGLAETAIKKQVSSLTLETIQQGFYVCEDFVATDYSTLQENFDLLLSLLGVTMAQVGDYTNYDTSTLSRIRKGTRRPADIVQFTDRVIACLVDNATTLEDLQILSHLFHVPLDSLSDPSVRNVHLKNWIYDNHETEQNAREIYHFLNRLDEFDLNAYIRILHFDNPKPPRFTLRIPSSRNYYGLQEMMEAELDFLKAAIVSRSSQDLIMYSDMPMEELPLDPSFPKKWMHGMELVLKKGLRIQQIHNLNRPFHEVLLGLESWIPLYMTGQITSYYLKEPQNTAFSHLLRVSGSTILVGYSITGYHADGTYYLTSSRKEVDCYRKQAKDLLSHAFPLVETYRSSRKEAFQAFLEKSAQQKGDRKNLLTTLPLYTLHEDTLLSILHEAGIPSSVQKEILQYYHAKRERVETILKQGTLTDEVPFPSEAEFSSSPLYLELSGIFSDRNIEYSYALYQRHYAETEEFAENHPNYTLLKEEFRAFRNIQLCLLKDRWAMVSKANSPAIHFIVRHPVLLHALENFAPPYTE